MMNKTYEMRSLFITILFVFLPLSLFAKEQTVGAKTICLNMIVKNEARIIERTLASVKDLIHYWVIVDTGSTDGTQEVIKQFLQEIPGELHERPWVDFGHNRNEALDLAKNHCDYVLFMDADEVLMLSNDFAMPDLLEDAYSFLIQQAGTGTTYQRVLLINNHLSWKWQGVLHEVITGPLTATKASFPGAIVLSYTEGFRSQDPQKYVKDVEILEQALKEDPSNTRYVYYLAQSYLHVPNYEKALEYYTKRALMGGWDQECFFSMYCMGLIQEILQRPIDEILKSYFAAYHFRTSRAEPLYRIAQKCMEVKDYQTGYLFSLAALDLPLSNDSVFVENWIYEWGALLQFAECSYVLGKYQETKEAIYRLLLAPTLPQETKEQLKRNLTLIEGF